MRHDYSPNDNDAEKALIMYFTTENHSTSVVEQHPRALGSTFNARPPEWGAVT
jgi:hypothetical protein